MFRNRWLATVVTVPLLVACAGTAASEMSLDQGWEDAVTACVLANVIVRATIVEPEGTNPERARTMFELLPQSAAAAAAASPTYIPLDRLVQTFIASLDVGADRAITDLVAVGDECSRLGLSPNAED